MANQTSKGNIRQAELADASEIRSLAEQLGYPNTISSIESRLEIILKDPAQVVFISETENGEICGYVHAIHQVHIELQPLVEIAGLVVHSDYRHAGYGKSLMARAEHWAFAKGCRIVRLHSNIIRKEAHNFYRSLGYDVYKTQYSFIKTSGDDPIPDE